MGQCQGKTNVLEQSDLHRKKQRKFKEAQYAKNNKGTILDASSQVYQPIRTLRTKITSSSDKANQTSSENSSTRALCGSFDGQYRSFNKNTEDAISINNAKLDLTKTSKHSSTDGSFLESDNYHEVICPQERVNYQPQKLTPLTVESPSISYQTYDLQDLQNGVDEFGLLKIDDIKQIAITDKELQKSQLKENRRSVIYDIKDIRTEIPQEGKCHTYILDNGRHKEINIDAAITQASLQSEQSRQKSAPEIKQTFTQPKNTNQKIVAGIDRSKSAQELLKKAHEGTLLQAIKPNNFARTQSSQSKKLQWHVGGKETTV